LQVGINLGDPIFRGIYHGKKAHDDDLQDVLQRAVDVGCTKLMVTGSDLTESRKAVQLARDHRTSGTKCAYILQKHRQADNPDLTLQLVSVTPQ
jgi:Tat protein secretion system quality control protein TatD with DNase activity